MTRFMRYAGTLRDPPRFLPGSHHVHPCASCHKPVPCRMPCSAALPNARPPQGEACVCEACLRPITLTLGA